MALSITKALNIESHERGIVLLLLTQSVFLGIFAGALDVGANALFLEAYSADRMPQAFMISGAVGIFFTSMYAWFQKRIPFKLFTIINLLIAIILTAGLRLGYQLTDDSRLAFLLLVMMGPIIIISMLGFWGTAGRYFTLREGKRLFGIIDTGSIIGMIIAFYAVPLLVTINFKVYDTLMIGLISLLLAMTFQLIVIQRYKLLQVKGEKKEKRKSGFFQLFRNRYTSRMAIFVMLSVIVAFFIHYSFMWATEANYSDSRELTSFLGAFFGTMMIFTVILKSTLYGWLMKNYGLRITLLISPALLLILTLVASLVGGIFGYEAEAASFTFFFLVIALSKLFNRSLKDSIESPSMKILYQSLDSDIRFDVQARIDGIVNELTAFSAGLIMAGLLLLSFITVIHFSFILIAVLVIWVILGVYLYRSYRKTLNDSLASARSRSAEGETVSENIEGKLQDAGMYRDLVQLDPYFFHQEDPTVTSELLMQDDISKQLATWRIADEMLFNFADQELLTSVEKQADPELKKITENYKLRLKLPGRKIDDAFRSQDKNKVLSALTQAVIDQDLKQVPHIITLLRDRDLQIRSAAIQAAGEMKARELGSYLADYLGHPDLYLVTWSALVQMGEMILDNLENTFHKAGTPIHVQLRIVRAMAEIGGDRANRLLFSKINYHQREIQDAVVEGLYENKFKATARELNILQTEIYNLVKAGAMNLAAEFVVRENNPENGLDEAIGEEITRTNSILFKILGIAYDRNAIDHVRRSIQDVDNEDAGFALELLNLIVDEEVYAYLEAYFDDLSVSEKIRRLQNEMPVEILAFEEVLIDLLNRDRLYTGDFLRLCVIDTIDRMEELEAGQYLAAQVFHPDPMISGPASTVLANKEPEYHSELSQRIQLFESKFTREKFKELKMSDAELMHLPKLLKEWNTFASVRLEDLLKLARHLRRATKISLQDTTKVTLVKSEIGGDMLGKGILINLTDYPDLLRQMEYIADEQGEIYQIERKELRELLFDSPSLLEACRMMFLVTKVESKE